MERFPLSKAVPIAVFACGLAMAGALSPAIDGKPVVTPFGTTEALADAFHGHVFELRSEPDRIPDFEQLHSISDLYTWTLNVQPQIYTAVYPGVIDTSEWFGIEYHAQFWVDAPIQLRFALVSDDGSKLYIDDLTAIDNDGMHVPAARQSVVSLRRGLHRMRVDYFQGKPNGVALVLAVAKPGEPLQIFDLRNFAAPAGTPALKVRPGQDRGADLP